MPTASHHRQRHCIAATALAAALALVLAACHQVPPPSNATPEQAVATNLHLTATGDFDGLVKNRMPPADYAQWRSEWEQAHRQLEPASADRQKQFAEIMRMLTEPGAEAKLAKRLQPELAKLHGGLGESMPIFSGILEAAGKQMIAASPQLGPTQKALATQGLGALIAWVDTTDFSDPKKAEKAVALVCATARRLHVQTLPQWRALDYALTMRNYGIIWNGLEQLLGLYGLDFAGSLTRAQVSTVANDGTHATVKLDMNLAGQPLTGEWPMQKQAGHWYDTALLAAWQQAHPAPTATVAGPAAGGGSVATAASVLPTATASPASSPPPASPPASAHSPAGSGS